jgi:hypothetical protein
MEPRENARAFSWSKVSIILASLALGALLFCGIRGLGDTDDSVGGLFAALQIVAAPGALVLIILAPYMVVHSGQEWVEKRQSEADFLAESAHLPRLSLLRSSEPALKSDEALLRPIKQDGEADSRQMLRAASMAVEGERG